MLKNESVNVDILLRNARKSLFTYPEKIIDVIMDFRNASFFENPRSNADDDGRSYEPVKMFDKVIEAYDLDLMDTEAYENTPVPAKNIWRLVTDLIDIYEWCHNPHAASSPPMFNRPAVLAEESEDNIPEKSCDKSGITLEYIFDVLKSHDGDNRKHYSILKYFMELPLIRTLDILNSGGFARSDVFGPLKNMFVDYYDKKYADVFSFRIKDIFIDLTSDVYIVKDPEELNYRYALISSLLYDVLMFDQGYYEEEYLDDIEIMQLINEADIVNF
jgi:hypothetical protein